MVESIDHTTSVDAIENGRVRTLALAGVVGPIAFWLVVIPLGFVTPGYSPVADFISTLGEVGAPYAIVQRVNFIVLGASILALTAGLHYWRRGGRRPTIGVLLLGVLGVGIVGSGVFSANTADPTSTTNVLHDIFGITAFFAGIIGISLVSRQLDRDERWPRHRFATAGTVVLLVFTFGLFIATIESPWLGITQRLFLAVLTGWIAYHSFRLFQLTPREEPTV